MPDTDWQINNKINPSQLPEWDGDGNAMIDYLSSVSGFAAMSNKMQVGVGKMAPLRWTGNAKVWWDTISQMDREFYGQDWPHLVDAIRSQFMSPNWVQDRQREFEEMSFRQKGYSDEKPVAFIQRRIRFHSFLYPQDPDGPNAVA